MSETLWQKFRVGQRVWCMNADPNSILQSPGWKRTGNLDGLKEGGLYTIRSILVDPDDDELLFRLAEIVRGFSPRLQCEAAFDARRFKPLREQNIEIFRKMCRDSKTPASKVIYEWKEGAVR